LLVGRKIFFYVYRQYRVENEDSIRDFFYYSAHIDFSGKRVLDVGCGQGKKTIYYSDRCMRATGIDINKSSIKTACEFAREHKKDIDFLVADGLCLPFKRNSFDLVISNDVFEHIKNPKKSFIEMERVVKKGGHLCINFGPLWRSPFGGHLWLKEFFGAPWIHLFFPAEIIKNMLITFGKYTEKEYEQIRHLSRITVPEFEAMLKQKGFKILHFELITYPPCGFLSRTSL
jgi:ubiquinone/menaquinone biosynthesis C-methylase UbiE